MIITTREYFGAPVAPCETTWENACRWFDANKGHVQSTKESCPTYVWAACDGGFLDAQISREGLWAVTLDFDALDPVGLGQFIEFAKEQSARYLIHTTWSHAHDPSCSKMRVTYPLDAPCPREYWPQLYGEIARDFDARGFATDASTAHFARCWFQPQAGAQTPWLIWA